MIMGILEDQKEAIISGSVKLGVLEEMLTAMYEVTVDQLAEKKVSEDYTKGALKAISYIAQHFCLTVC